MEFELGQDKLYYYISSNNIYYIGNGDIFIQGTYYNNNSVEITCIKSDYKYNIDMIVSNSYKKIGEHKYNNKDEAINFNEMIKIWNKYNNYNLDDIPFISRLVFRMNGGNLLNKIKYKNVSLFDIILYKNIISNTDLVEFNTCFNTDKKNRINQIYNKIIFN